MQEQEISNNLFNVLSFICHTEGIEIPGNLKAGNRQLEKIITALFKFDVYKVATYGLDNLGVMSIPILIEQAIAQNKLEWLHTLLNQISLNGPIINLNPIFNSFNYHISKGIEQAGTNNSFKTVNYILDNMPEQFSSGINCLHFSLYNAVIKQNEEYGANLMLLYYEKYSKLLLDELIFNIFDSKISSLFNSLTKESDNKLEDIISEKEQFSKIALKYKDTINHLINTNNALKQKLKQEMLSKQAVTLSVDYSLNSLINKK